MPKAKREGGTAAWIGRPGLLPILAGGTALVVYLVTASPDLTWAFDSADGAELITAACTLGVPHPPGYPTYVLIGRVICALPVQPTARAFHYFSATSGAVAAGLVTASARHVVTAALFSPRAAVATGLFFAWLLPVWQQAAVAEVYTLNLAFLAAFLWSLLGRRPAWLSGLLLGLSITTHLTSLFMVPAALLLLPRRQWPMLASGLSLGLLPFLVLPLLSLGHSPVVWGQPQEPDGWWWLVSARLYQPNLWGLPPGRWATRLVTWGRILLPQLAGAALLVAAAVARHRRSPGQPSVARAFGFPLLFYLTHAFFYDSPDSLVLLLPALLLLSLFIAPFMHSRPNLALFLPILLLLLNFNRFEPGTATQARALAESVLQQAPPDAILLTTGDRSTFALWYLQGVERERSDVTIVNRHLLGYSWYRDRLRQAEPGLAGLATFDLEQFRRLNERPLCDVEMDATDERAVTTTVSCVQIKSER